MARALAGETGAFELLVQRYQDFVYIIALRTVQDRAEAEDVAQETFLRAYQALRTFRGDAKFSSWLYRIAVNRSIAHLRRKRRDPLLSNGDERSLDSLSSAPSSQESPEEGAARAELRTRLDRAIANLPPEYRIVVTLYHLEERKYREVAEILGLPIGTVKSHLHRARALLRESLGGP